jgi:predicted transcriptional regulator
MKKIWNDERRAKEMADRERTAALEAAQRLLEENKRIKEMLQSGEEEYKNAKQNSANSALKVAKQAYKEAYEAGDAEKLMEAQQQMFEAQLELERANKFKLPPLQTQEIPVQTNQQYQPAPQPDDKVMDWQARNPWFGQDEEMTAAALGLHEKLKRQGVAIGSDEYYSAIDKTMRKRFAENFDDNVEEEVEPKAAKPTDKPAVKPSTVVAPATRSTASKKIRLKTSQVAIAKKLGLTPEQYVRELLKLEA